MDLLQFIKIRGILIYIDEYMGGTNMENLIATIMNAIESMPWILLVAAAVLILLPIIIMSAVHASARRRWQQESADQIDRYETVSRKVRELNDQLGEKEKEIKKLQADEEAWANERTELGAHGDALNAQLDEQGKTIVEKDSELDRLHADEAVWANERAELNDRNNALNAELSEARLALEEKTQTLDKLYADQDDWNRQKDEILASAHEAAERIIDEASKRLAESEEEVRKNRLIAAGSLNDARRRISDMLLSAASELSKGLPASESGTPIGYAPVYSIEEQKVEENAEEKADDAE